MEYRYSDDRPAWSNDYVWPMLTKLLRKHAPAPRKVFEIGCGNGATARMLAGEGYCVVGVDPSPSGIAIAKTYEAECLHFEVASTAEDLGARFGRFPVVVSLEVIEHCLSAREFMGALRSVLAPGGIGVISTPYHSYLKNLLIVAGGRFDRHFDPLWEGGHVKFFTNTKLQELFRQSEFQKFEFHRVGRIPPLAKSVVATVFDA
jgi:2-polyprenyl-6-hydroxyphenyl methylase/3-demethylubiquinone-9 3-methyltransferase